MMQIKLRLENKEGLHARPAGVLAKVAAKYQSKIELKAKGQTKNAKSIMGLMSMGLEQGDELEFVVDGGDEAAAIENLKTLVQNQFIEAP